MNEDQRGVLSSAFVNKFNEELQHIVDHQEHLIRMCAEADRELSGAFIGVDTKYTDPTPQMKMLLTPFKSNFYKVARANFR